jgi:adenosylcobinamide kinase/adenosylcobinamide-phosphate guanylyltransferase
VERARDTAGALSPRCDAAVVDCLTLLVAQLLLGGAVEREILDEVSSLVDAPPCPLFVVTNEVGWGIVPETAQGRRFREVLGRANRLAAGRADEVVLMVSGLPVRIKGES